MSDKTIDYYSRNSEEYAGDTFSADMSDIYGRFLPYIQENGRILDLGCGSGRDAACFSSMGFSVEAVDGTPELCMIAEKNTGLNVRCMRFDELDYVDEFDGVWACASLLHIEREDLPDVFRKIRRALREGGVFYCSFKYGTSSYERNGRFFTDLDEESFISLASETGFSSLDLFRSGDVRKDRSGEQWLNAISRKV